MISLKKFPKLSKVIKSIYLSGGENNYTKLKARRTARMQVDVEVRSSSKKFLTPEQHREVKDFFGRFGLKPYWKFHVFYTKATGKYYKEYLPDDIYYIAIDPYYNDWTKAYSFDDKAYYDLLFKDMGFMLPEPVCYCINGVWLDTAYAALTELQALTSIEAAGEAFLKKAFDSEGGHGVIYYNKKTDTSEDLNDAIRKLGGSFVVQKPIRQSSVLEKVNESSVNTVRVLSMLGKDGSVKIYSSILRMGIKGSKVDNASSGGITCGIEPDGRLKPRAFTALGKKFDWHPDNGLKFNDITIPNFDKILDLVKKGHPRFPHFRLLSWDIALDEQDRPLLLEINMRYGELDFHQLNNGPVFGADTEKILAEVFG